MSRFFVFILAIGFCVNVNAQNSLQADYLEVFPFGTGWEFRTSPSSPFQSVGFLGEHIAPYFQGNESAQDAFRRYKVYQSMALASNFTMLAGTGMILYGINQENRTSTRMGLVGNFVGLALLYFSSESLNKNLYQAVDIYNFKRSPLTTQVTIDAFIPKIQPSSHTLGMGLVWEIH